MRDMRRTDRTATEEEAYQVLQEGTYGILATVDQEGQPYGVPLSYVLIDRTIYYHATNAGGTKQDNLEQNPKVTFTVVGKTRVLPEKFGTLYESAIALGTASVVTDEEERMLAFREFVLKYSADFIPEGEKYIETMGPKAIVVKIPIESLTGKHRVS